MNLSPRSERWSPYLVGTGIGLLSWITFYFMDKALGTSTTMVKAAGALEAAVAPDHVRENAYFAKYLIGAPAFDWQAALVVAMALGAWISARLSGSIRREWVPELWSRRFGPSPLVRAIGAFLGGALLLMGARLAGGCTSGHAISGGLQFAVSSWIFLAAMFVSGIATAFAIYRREG